MTAKILCNEQQIPDPPLLTMTVSNNHQKERLLTVSPTKCLSLPEIAIIEVPVLLQISSTHQAMSVDVVSTFGW